MVLAKEHIMVILTMKVNEKKANFMEQVGISMKKDSNLQETEETEKGKEKVISRQFYPMEAAQFTMEFIKIIIELLKAQLKTFSWISPQAVLKTIVK